VVGGHLEEGQSASVHAASLRDTGDSPGRCWALVTSKRDSPPVSTPLRSGTQGTVPRDTGDSPGRSVRGHLPAGGSKPVSRIEATRPARLGTWWETAYQTISQSMPK